ncbi:hypothetical protein AXF42_Ash013668 [Apostasia shenzhenica]|uniref:SWIM-type domain-containing protein n=1 Tax=Apostasia shenzhenica TaxID=1088818 RepID=A0A2I0APK5_9ASPA|nr:hypothetical protein AXF42_Ash013668 [Apostasia shenzhenica]
MLLNICHSIVQGLDEAIEDIFPLAGQRHCCRHLYSNFKKYFPATILRKYFWGAAKAYTEYMFNKEMNFLKANNKDTYDWLMHPSRPKHRWARHTFDTSIKVDMVTNNLAECFNSWISDERDKPILTLLEAVRLKLMLRFSKMRQVVGGLSDSITYSARKRLAENDNAPFMIVIPSSITEFQVVDNGHNFSVYLAGEKKGCDCKVWNISGIPCKHVLKCIGHNRDVVADYCSEYFKRDKYMKAYQGSIPILPDVRHLVDAEDHTVLPPIIKRKAGRPKLSRRREEGEKAAGPTRGRKRNSVTCSHCGCIGHNRKSCQRVSVGSNKRNRTNVLDFQN